MNNKEKYVAVYVETFGIKAEEADTLEYAKTPEWDSVGHMSLIAALEEAFGIEMDTDDIIDFSSYQKGMEILQNNYNVKI